MSGGIGQRRLAAIMVADVVGFSRLMEADEAGTLQVLKERRKAVLEPVVKAHGGRIVKVMGDGVLIEFASAVAAVEAALALQENMTAANEALPEARRIVLRIGVNLGDVIGEGSDIYGEGVNIAARLEALAEPGSICISGKVHEEIRGKLDVVAEDLGEVSLKNLARPVRAFRLATYAAGERSVGTPVSGQDRPSIAVLPFANMSGDPEQEYFADGLTEDIITALSRSVRLSVIARTSTFGYKGKTADIKRIASELDVPFVLEGSVRRAGNRVRVTAQLIDAGSGSHVWAEKFDGALDDIFDIQDRITRSVAASTQTTIFSAMQRTPRALELISSPAYRLAYQAGACLYQMTPEGIVRGAALAEQALALDPDCAFAHRVRANAFLLHLATGALPHTKGNVERGLALSEEALRRDPDDEFNHWQMAFALTEAGRYEEAVAELDIGLSINPNASMLLGDKGDILVMLGRAEEAIPLCELALRLNPRDPVGYWWENSIATAHFIAGRTQEALDWSRRVTMRKPDHVRAAVIWAAAAGVLGRSEDAGEAVGRCLARFPDMSLSNVMPNFIPTFRRPEDRERLLDGLRKAGLPE